MLQQTPAGRPLERIKSLSGPALGISLNGFDKPIHMQEFGMKRDDVVLTRRLVLLLWTAFFVVSLSPLVWGTIFLTDFGFGDALLYHHWVREGLEHGTWPVIDEPWVYPLGALVPMSLLAPISDALDYVVIWWGLILVFNAATLIVVRDGLPNGVRASWWWLAFLFLLGPTGLSRIDSIAATLATIALVLISRHPRFATTLVAIAGWVKVAHFAWLLPLFIISRCRIRHVLAPSTIVTAVVVGFGLSFGSGWRIFGFLTQQSSRGLQAESVFATPLSVARMFGTSENPRFNFGLKTWEYSGAMSDRIATALDPVLIIAVFSASFLVFLAHRRQRTSPTELIALSTFAMMLILIVFNKVGSTQFTLWLAAPLVLSFATFSNGSTPTFRWRVPLTISLVVATLSQLVYPLFYSEYTGGTAAMILVGALRNLLVVALLVWTLRSLWVAGRSEQAFSYEHLRHGVRSSPGFSQISRPRRKF